MPDHPRRCPSKAGMTLRQGARASSCGGSRSGQRSSFPFRPVGRDRVVAVCSVPQAWPGGLQSWEEDHLLLRSGPAEARDAV